MRIHLLGFWTATFVAACSATNAPRESAAGAGGASSSATGSSATGSGGDMSITVGSGGGMDAGPCSADLQHVVGADGKVIEDCPPDQGCAAGVCVPACQAAAAAKGSIGCDFASPSPPLQQGTFDGACYAVFVSNTWARSAKLDVKMKGQSLGAASAWLVQGVVPNVTYSALPAAGLAPGEVAVVFLSHKPGAQHPNFGTSLECPKPPAFVDDAAVHGSGRGVAFEITSDTPVTVYDIAPYGGAQSYLPSASLLMPTTAWGTTHAVVAPHPDGEGPPWMTLVGTVDGTQVQVAPRSFLEGGIGVPEVLAGQTAVVTIDAGETIQWMYGDPTGAVVKSDHPIGVFTGSAALTVKSVTSESTGADAAHQQIPHSKALANEYLGAGVMTRLASLAPESVPYRLLGVVDGTTFAWDPAPPANAPSSLKAGEAVEFEATTSFVVRSQDEDHPFLLTQYMSNPVYPSRDGCGPVTVLGGVCSLGDTDWIALVPPKQYLGRYVFFTDPTYATTSLVITREKGPGGFAAVSVDCLGEVQGFKPVGNGGNFEVAYVDLMRGGVAVGGCNAARHEATSQGRFGVVVWGTDDWSSYGYPAGGNAVEINQVELPIPK